jgi:predicted tellurium resistance membrane protein TerC
MVEQVNLVLAVLVLHLLSQVLALLMQAEAEVVVTLAVLVVLVAVQMAQVLEQVKLYQDQLIQVVVVEAVTKHQLLVMAVQGVQA